MRLTEMDPKVLADWVASADGWTIWDADAMAAAGFPAGFLAGVTQTYKSDTSDPKATIFGNDGAVITETRGVYALTFLGAVARELGADTTGVQAMGRGFRARQYQAAITAALAAPR